MNKIIDRLKERSTWIGLTALLTAAGVNVSPEWTEVIVSVGVGIGGAIAIVTKD